VVIHFTRPFLATPNFSFWLRLCVGCTVLSACFCDTAQRGLVLSPAGFLNPLCAEVLSVRRALFHLVTTSFRPHYFDSTVTLIQTAVHHISYMTVSLLTPISSETDFFLIGLKRQLTKIHSFSRSRPIPLTQLAILASSSIITTFYLTKSQIFPNLVIVIIVNLAASVPTSTSKLPVPLLHLLFTLNLIIAALSILQSNKISNKSSSTNSELSCSCCLISAVSQLLSWCHTFQFITYCLATFTIPFQAKTHLFPKCFPVLSKVDDFVTL